MELRYYWTIIRRRWLWLIAPAVVVLLIGLLTYRPAPTTYNTGVRFISAQTPGAAALDSDEQRYYNWLTSEYIVNGLGDWIRGGVFAQEVSDYLLTQGIGMPPGAIQGGLSADNTRSMLTVSLNGPDPLMVEQMMTGVIAVITEQNAAALPQLGGENAVLVQLDEPVVNAIPAGITSQLDLPLRVALALAAGLALALLAEYFDPTVRDRRDVDELGLEILGAIPKK
jgi:capsular polysaccharide biosynthesis protein